MAFKIFDLLNEGLMTQEEDRQGAHWPELPFMLHEPVALACDIETNDGVTIPAGTRGVIIEILEGGLYDVEFYEPYDCVATLRREEVSALG